MDFERLARRTRLEKLKKDVALWEAFKRAMNSLVESMKSDMDYDDWLDLKAKWDGHRGEIDSIFEEFLNGRG